MPLVEIKSVGKVSREKKEELSKNKDACYIADKVIQEYLLCYLNRKKIKPPLTPCEDNVFLAPCSRRVPEIGTLTYLRKFCRTIKVDSRIDIPATVQNHKHSPFELLNDHTRSLAAVIN